MVVTKRAMTLLEIMMVILIIGIIAAVTGKSMKGNLDKGKVFQSEQGSRMVYDMLALEIAQGTSIEDVIRDPKAILEASGMAQNPEKLLKDGWGHPYQIIQTEGEDFVVYSKTFIERLRAKRTDEEIAEQYPWMYTTNIEESFYAH